MKKITIFLLIVMLVLGMATACSETSDNEATPSPDAESPSAPPEAEPDEPITLVAPKIGLNDDQLAVEEAAEGGLSEGALYYIAVMDTIAEEYPNYEMEYVDWGWAETLDQKQRALITSGDVPDIVAGETFIPTYAMEGILEPLPQDIVDMVNPSFMVYDADGVPVAVAQKSAVFMLFYNKDLMAQAGLDPETPPTTWDEWQEMSDAITAAGNGDFYGGGIPSFPHAGGALRATPFFRQMGTDFAVDGQPNLTDPKLQETLQYIREMNANFPAGLANQADEGPLWTAFEKDHTIGFVVNGTWEANGAEVNGVNWGVAPLPMPEGGVTGNCLVGSVYNAVPKAAKNKEASFNVIRAVLKYENQLLQLDDNVCSPLNAIIEDTSLYEDNPTLMTAFESVRNGEFAGLATFAKNDGQAWEIINNKVLARTTITDDDIATICEDAQAEIEPLLE